jgi:hypothetical protein
MAKAISNQKNILPESNFIVGSQIIDIVTAGMYNNPLMVDAAYERGFIASGEERIDVKIDGINRNISVMDNGVGVSRENADVLLRCLGCSTKDRQKQRGFRGIGRLGGLGYCDQVIFETRGGKAEPIFTLTWDAKKLQEATSKNGNGISAEEAIEKAVSVDEKKSSPNDPPRFFRVTMRNVRQFHRDELMNPRSVANFLGKIAPVDFAASFAFAPDIRKHVSSVPGYQTYNIFMNGDKIVRPHTGQLPLHGKNSDVIKGIEAFTVKGPEGRDIGRGWYAVTNFLAALPPQVAMRGMRVRQGNIEIGDEYHLASLYSERRFASWHIGEVHLDYSVKANARRDGFEQSPEHEAFLEQMNSLCRHLSGQCRDSSKRRSKEKTIENTIDRLEELVNLRVVIDGEDLRQCCEQVETRIREIVDVYGDSEYVTHLKERFHNNFRAKDAEMKLKPIFAELIDGRRVQTDPRGILQEIAKAVLDAYDGKMSKDRLLFEIFGRYMRKNALKKLLQA